jgi:hypothetical protein
MRSATGPRTTHVSSPASSLTPNRRNRPARHLLHRHRYCAKRLVTLDDERRQLVCTIVDGPYSHHNGSAQIIRERDNRTRFVWITDVLPDEHAASLDPLMERGITIIKETAPVVLSAAIRRVDPDHRIGPP